MIRDEASGASERDFEGVERCDLCWQPVPCEHVPAKSSSGACECLDYGHDSGDGVHCLCGGVMPRAKCGSFGCTLPAGHNMGRADVPSNHSTGALNRHPLPCGSFQYAQGCICARCMAHQRSRDREYRDDKPKRRKNASSSGS